MYILWEQNNKGRVMNAFEDYYMNEMDKIIEHFKSKIE